MRRRSGLINIRNDFYRKGGHNKRHKQLRTCKRLDELSDDIKYGNGTTCRDEIMAEIFVDDYSDVYDCVCETTETPTIEEYNDRNIL